jgi:hypothetical protein
VIEDLAHLKVGSIIRGLNFLKVELFNGPMKQWLNASMTQCLDDPMVQFFSGSILFGRVLLKL